MTPKNFLNILKGDASAVTGGNGKVLKSNANSKVFINFADHGAPGLIAFPSEYLYAPDLHTALTFMHTNNMYKELVFYLEACESGSMFDGILENNLGIYAITAANPSESSWGTYCPPDDVVNGEHLNTCLGDLFSVNWMEDTEAKNVHTESLSSQFDVILKETAQSHVMKYGQETFTKEPIGNFQGSNDDAELTMMFERMLSSKTVQQIEPNRHISTVNTRDAKLNHLYATLSTRGGQIAHLDLATELNVRMRVGRVVEKLTPRGGLRANSEDGHLLPKNFDCLKTLMATYESSCGKMSDYELQFVKYLVNECEFNLPNATDFTEAIKKVRAACTH